MGVFTKKSIKILLKLVVTIALISFVLWYVGGVRKVALLFSDADAKYIILGLIVATADRALMSYKWGLLLSVHGAALPFFCSLRIYCASMIWGLFLPTGLGSDAIRGFLAYRMGLNGSVVTASIIVERLVGFMVSLLLGLLGLLILSHKGILTDQYESIWWVSAALILGGASIIAISFSQVLFDYIYGRIPQKLARVKLVVRIKSLHETYMVYKKDVGTISIFFVLTVIENFIAILLTYVITIGLNVDIDLVFLIGIIPLTVLITRLPIAIDGIGVLEGLFVILMGLGGVPGAEAVAIALTIRVVQIFTWLPWWISYVIENKNVRAPNESNTGSKG